MNLFAFLFLVRFVVATDDENYAGHENCTVYTTSGVVQGILQKSPRKYYEVEYYPCIPYAQQSTRFGNTEKPKYDATKRLNRNECSVCIQPDGSNTKGSEDCLFLHVFVPRKCAKEQLSVMVYFHAGVFYLGNGPKQHSYLLDECVIVVTVNYRLGPLGFLSLFTPRCPGNAGLKDSLAALEWVHDNIASFGGNPNSVTINGLGAGGAIATYLMMNPRACGLFQNVIAGSGVALNPWAFIPKERALRNAFELGRMLDCVGTEAEVCECLINAPGELLIQKARKVPSVDALVALDFTVFAPVAENPDSPDAFITDHPRNIVVREESMCKANILLGLVEDESCLFKSEVEKYKNYLPIMTNASYKFAPRCLSESTDSDCLRYISDEMNEYYTGQDDIYNEVNIMPALSTIEFVLDTMAFASILAKHRYEVFLYEFGYLGSCRSAVLYYPDAKKTCHGDEFTYQFVQEPFTFMCFRNQSEEFAEVVFSKRLNELYGQFIKTGSPTPINAIPGLEWPHWTNDNQSYLRIDTEFTVRLGLQNEHLTFWKQIIGKCDSERNYWEPDQHCCSVCDPEYTYPTV